nr:hypothetical protein [Tanacetum cinerariifolium]
MKVEESLNVTSLVLEDDDLVKDEAIKKQTKPPNPDRAWNKTLPATHESIQPWISNMAKTMDMTIDQQVALDEALIPHANRLRIGKSNFRFRSDITSKESTLQLEFWATATVHHHSIRFKMNSKKRIVNLEYFKEILHISLRLPNQTFDELPFEEEILAFLRYLRHGGEIRKITDVNINKLHQPWKSFAAVINKCLNGKRIGYDSLRFTKVIIHFFMTKDPLIPRRNKFDAMFLVELTNEDIKNSTAYKEYYAIASGTTPPKMNASVRKMQSSSKTTMPPPTAASTRLSTSTKGKQPAKSSNKKCQSMLFKVAMNEAERMKLATKRSLQQTHISQASRFGTDEGTGIIPGVPDVPTDKSDEEISWKSITLKRRHDDVDKDEEPSAGSDRGSKRRREGKEPELTSAPKEKATKNTGKSTQRFKSHQKTKQKKPSTPNCTWSKNLPATHGSIQLWISDLAKQADSRSSFNVLMDTHVDFSAFLMNRLKVDSLTLELLTGLTYELMKGSCKSLVELEFFLEKVYKATTDQLDWNNPKGQQYPHNLLKPIPLIPNSRGLRVIPFDHFINNDLEYLCGGAFSRKYTTSVTKTKAADYGHIKWIKDLSTRSLIEMSTQNIESSLSSNFRSSNGIITSIWIGSLSKKVEKSRGRRTLFFQRLSKNVHEKHRHPTACRRSSTRCRKLPKEAQPYKAGYNKDKQNRLMRIDELHKFSDGTLNDVRIALDDRLKGIQMKYLPQAIWRKSDKERAAAMIQAIDKQLKTRRIMRSLEKFVGGRLYEGDFRVLQRTI